MMRSTPRKPIRLCICSFPGYLPVVRATIEKVCEQLGFDADAAGSVVLSVDEALTNIIKHAYHGAADEPIEIEITPLSIPLPGGMQICIRDYGKCVEPAKIKSRDLEDVRPGGLGVHIMNECMDSVEFAHPEDGGTLLTMVKLTRNLTSKQEAAK